eukprot:TRINITY_DN1793_c0_g1_i1.p1 TRINITY_DN1793_c0_g1~~TRINITY_DN1793_c0_g1_i1.p1  ORF type:complete len:292 (-),score=70.94 TRINITY_DN1793_c0_g1_i1:47-892(-)
MAEGEVPNMQTLHDQLPQYYEDLLQSSKNIEQIALYCKAAYETESDKHGVVQKTQNYIKDALSNVAYHIHTMGLTVTNLLQSQANEIERLDLQIQALGDRMKSSKDVVGAVTFRTGPDSTRTSKRQPKIRRLEGPDLPDTARPLSKFTRQPLNLKALDNVGMDLAGNRGTEAFAGGNSGSFIQAPSGQAPPLAVPNKFANGPPLSNRPSPVRSGAPPPTLAPPTGLAPPPPSNFAPPPPPPRDSPAPPPAYDYDGYNQPELDAPPPPNFDDELPPPPPPHF